METHVAVCSKYTLPFEKSQIIIVKILKKSSRDVILCRKQFSLTTGIEIYG
jgi:hypothetical protein